MQAHRSRFVLTLALVVCVCTAQARVLHEPGSQQLPASPMAYTCITARSMHPDPCIVNPAYSFSLGSKAISSSSSLADG
jgi:hypothetical protein